MKNTLKTLATALVALVCAGCVKTYYERDFHFSTSVPKIVAMGDRVLATVKATPDSPLTGYEYRILLDGEEINVPGLGEYFTFEENGEKVLDITKFVTEMGFHTVDVNLHFSTWKSGKATFELRQDATTIENIEDSYDVVCTETLTIKPVVKPEPNTDTLRYRVIEEKGDFARITALADGSYKFEAEHQKPGSLKVEWYTHKCSRVTEIRFYKIPIEDIEGLETVYWANAREPFEVTFTVLPENHQEELTMKIDQTHGDVRGEKSDNGCTFYTSDLENGSAVVTLSCARFSRTFTVNFFEPTERLECSKSYECEATGSAAIELMQIPNISTDMIREPIAFEVTPIEGGEIVVTRGADDRHYTVTGKTGEPGSANVRFFTETGASVTAKVLCYHTIPVTVSEWTARRYDIGFTFATLPDEWKLKPSFTVGAEMNKEIISIIWYREGQGKSPDTVNAILQKTYQDEVAEFANDGGMMKYTFNRIANAYENTTASLLSDFYIHSDIGMAIFFNSSSPYYKVKLNYENAIKVDIWDNSPNHTPYKNTTKYNYCTFWPDTRAHAGYHTPIAEFLDESKTPEENKFRF